MVLPLKLFTRQSDFYAHHGKLPRPFLLNAKAGILLPAFARSFLFITSPVSRLWARRLVRAGVAGRGVNNRSRVLVVAHEFGVGGRELTNEVVQFLFQRFIRRVKRIAQLLRHRLAGGDGLPGFAHHAAERGDGCLQRGQLRRRHAVSGETGKVGVRKVVDVLAILHSVRVPRAGEVGLVKVHFRSEGVVLGFDGISPHRRGDADRCLCHRHFGRLFVLRDAAGVHVLALRQCLDETDLRGETRVSVHESLQGLPYGIIGIQDGLHSQIHVEFVLLFCCHVVGSECE